MWDNADKVQAFRHFNLLHCTWSMFTSRAQVTVLCMLSSMTPTGPYIDRSIKSHQLFTRAVRSHWCRCRPHATCTTWA